MQATTSKTLINRKTLLAMIPLSERTIFNLEHRGGFPRRIALTSRNVAWDLAEVEEWIEARKLSGAQATRPGAGHTVAAETL
jgi:prophage regulatory protein